MKDEYRLVRLLPSGKKRSYAKKTLEKALEALEWYKKNDIEAWIEVRQVGKWGKVGDLGI